MYKTKADLLELAPAAFRTKGQGAALGVSTKYQFMTTSDVIAVLEGMGWGVYDGKQQKSQKNPDTTKHMLRFRHDMYGSLGIDGNVPEILFINSHDRSSSLNFHVGIFRVINNTQLIVADSTFDQFRIRHMGTTFEQVQTVITEIAAGLPRIFKTIQTFEGTTLSTRQQHELAMKSLAIRFPEYLDAKTDKPRFDLIKESVDIDDLLKAQRPVDQGNNLWLTFNRVQEQILKGGFQRIGTSETSKSKAVRPLTNIRMELLVSKGIWSLADELAAKNAK